MTRAEQAQDAIRAQAVRDGVAVERVYETTSSLSGAAPNIVTTWRARIDVKGSELPVWYECKETLGTLSIPEQKS